MDFILHLSQAAIILTLIVALASGLLIRNAFKLINALFNEISELKKQLITRDQRIGELEQIVEHWRRKFNDLWEKYIELEQENNALKKGKKLL